MKKCLCVTLAFLVACATDVDCPAGDVGAECVPNGYCTSDSECAPSDFCLAEWCYSGPTCELVERCTRRGAAGSICEADRWCAEGLHCDLPKDCGGHPCTGSTCTAN